MAAVAPAESPALGADVGGVEDDWPAALLLDAACVVAGGVVVGRSEDWYTMRTPYALTPPLLVIVFLSVNVVPSAVLTTSTVVPLWPIAFHVQN
jgi:hypothetical protein